MMKILLSRMGHIQGVVPSDLIDRAVPPLMNGVAINRQALRETHQISVSPKQVARLT
jgi:hypothetical protein